MAPSLWTTPWLPTPGPWSWPACSSQTHTLRPATSQSASVLACLGCSAACRPACYLAGAQLCAATLLCLTAARRTAARRPPASQLIPTALPSHRTRRKRHTVQRQLVEALGRLMEPGSRVFLQSDVLEVCRPVLHHCQPFLAAACLPALASPLSVCEPCCCCHLSHMYFFLPASPPAVHLIAGGGAHARYF
jgi:hypothetical protein